VVVVVAGETIVVVVRDEWPGAVTVVVDVPCGAMVVVGRRIVACWVVVVCGATRDGAG
jgi:hypothetical protein